MAKKHPEGYLSAKESRRISRENRKITDQYEKQYRRKNVPEQEYLTQMHNPENAVEFDNLHTYFFTDVGTVKSVDGVSFEVPVGKTVGVVGESGCGKSVTSLSLMQLLQRPQGQIVDGQIRLNLGDKAYDIAKTPMEKMQKLDSYLITRFKLAFGNRIMKQLYDFIPVYVACGGTELGGMDYIIARKVLKKFESMNVSFVRDEITGLINYIEKTFGKAGMEDSKSYLRRIQNLY